MATPTKHAVCSASSSERWLNCTAAPRFEEMFSGGDTIDTKKGTLAHSICELYGKLAFSQITKRKFNTELKKLKEDPVFADEMIRTAEFYSRYLQEKAMTFPAAPNVSFEMSVDFSEYVPEGFGTCDCIMVGGDMLHITDYKNGRGVIVSSHDNSQMRLYALGALKRYSALYEIKSVSMAIVQPNVSEDVEEDVISAEDLRAWGEEIKPKAIKAYTGMGDYVPGSWCRFCRGSAHCRAYSKNYTALEDFKDLFIEGKLSQEEKAKVPADNMLSDAEIGDLLIRASGLLTWYDTLKDYALNAILDGREIPGWKVVEGRRIRAFADETAALNILRENGYTDETLYKTEAKSLAALEKEIGLKKFAELMSDQITYPAGKPTLVIESDKREPYKPAVADFAEIVNKTDK